MRRPRLVNSLPLHRRKTIGHIQERALTSDFPIQILFANPHVCLPSSLARIINGRSPSRRTSCDLRPASCTPAHTKKTSRPIPSTGPLMSPYPRRRYGKIFMQPAPPPSRVNEPTLLVSAPLQVDIIHEHHEVCHRCSRFRCGRVERVRHPQCRCGSRRNQIRTTGTYSANVCPLSYD